MYLFHTWLCCFQTCPGELFVLPGELPLENGSIREDRQEVCGMDHRVFLVVLDSFGIGAEPDAGDFGDVGSNTLATIVQSPFYHTPNLERLGLFQIDGVECKKSATIPLGAYGRMQEQSRGKDTTVGHWEIAAHLPGGISGFGDPGLCREDRKRRTVQPALFRHGSDRQIRQRT